MNLHREDIKHGIDKAAESLKHAVDSIADSPGEIAQKTGDEMIGKGRRLKRAADTENEAAEERQFPC